MADEMKAKFSSVDEYITASAPAARPVLVRLRELAKKAVPQAQETISYQMPALRLTRVFFYFAAFKRHIGIYPPLKDDRALIKELDPYRNEKGNLKFPLDEPLPYELIERLVIALAKQYEK